MKMPASPRPFRLARSLVWAAAFVLATPGFGWALNPTVRKHFLPTSQLATEELFGSSVALTDLFVLVGDRYDSKNANTSGTVHVFDARTGRYLRRLDPTNPVEDAYFGEVVAISGTIALVGAPNEGPAARGAAYVFDLRTGRQLHRLQPGAGNALNGMTFGNSVDISGRKALIGARGHNSYRGAAFVFDIIEGGDEERMLVADDGAASDELGISVSLSGHLALVGADEHDNYRGAAYLFDISTGQQLHKLQASDGGNSHDFGCSVALWGTRALVGAQRMPTSGNDAGAAYYFDLSLPGGATIVETRKILPDDLSAFDGFGTEVALTGDTAFIGAPRHDGIRPDGGAIYAILPDSGEVLAKFAPAEKWNAEAHSLAVFGNTVAVSSIDESDRNDDRVGAAIVVGPIVTPLSLTSRATLGGTAPQADPALFRAFGNAFINADENVAFHGILTSNRGRDQGIWSDVAGLGAGPPRLDAKSGDALDTWASDNSAPGAILASLKTPVMNQDDQGIFEGTLAGPGINRSNRSALYSFDGGGNYHELLRTGKPLLLNGEAPALFQEFVQNRGTGATSLFSLAYLLQRGVAGVDLTTDSGALLHGNSSFDLEREVAREGQPVPVFGGGIYRQFLGRTAMMHDSIYSFPAYWLPTGETLPVQGLFADTAAGPGGDFARQGGNTTGWPGRSLGTFLAESMNISGWHLYRATMTGPDVNRTNNEGIWHGNFGSVVAKGEVGGGIDGLPDGTVVKILSFWPVRDENTLDAAIVLLQLGGPGIRRTNDIVLMLLEDGQEAQVLLREGQPVADCDAPAIAAIQRVDVDPVNGHYVILASLTGNRAKNQALFTGNAAAGDPTTRRILRSPTLRLRKGTLYSAANSVVTGLRSLNLSPTTDRGGAGGKGRGQVINDSGQIAVTLQFDNRAVEMMTGRP